MSNKYYIPKIEEFHVEFEYFENQKKDKFYLSDDIYKMHKKIRSGFIKVKYLDREDIESLGFEQIEYDVYKKENVYVELNMEYKTFISAVTQGESSILFQGTIKNKSELKRILKQLGINGNN